ncbi:MAG: LemA family protein [Phycisphaerales bacterium]
MRASGRLATTPRLATRLPAAIVSPPMDWVFLLLAGLGLFFVPLVVGVAIQNRLAASRVRVEGAFAQIEVQLQRRHDLVPRLVEVVRGAMAHERETLERVSAARTRAAPALEAARAGAPGEMPAAEKDLDASVSTLLARIEAYPQLKSSENALALQEEIVTSENRVAFARHAYNDSVVRYNVAIREFPANLVASFLRYREAQVLEWDSASIAAAPTVSMDRRANTEGSA